MIHPNSNLHTYPDPSSLFMTNPKLFSDYNQWKDTSFDHNHLNSDEPWSFAPQSTDTGPLEYVNHNPEYLSPIASTSSRDVSPLLNSPLSSPHDLSSPELYNTPYEYFPPPSHGKGKMYSPYPNLNSNYSSDSMYHSEEYESSSPSRPYEMKFPAPERKYGAIKPFILKLGFLLSKPELYSDVARWDATGTSFIITMGDRLNQVFQELFSHSSFTAFSRQLTTYCFIHLKPVDLPETTGQSSKAVSIWQHQFFTRDDTSTLNRLLPRPSRARTAEKKEKVARSTLENYSENFMRKLK